MEPKSLEAGTLKMHIDIPIYILYFVTKYIRCETIILDLLESFCISELVVFPSSLNVDDI